jgi:hypothetical protein
VVLGFGSAVWYQPPHKNEFNIKLKGEYKLLSVVFGDVNEAGIISETAG